MDGKAFIPFLAFLWVFILAYKRKNKISMVIVGMFLLSSISSFFMDSEVLPYHNFDNDSVYFFILYTILLTPFLYLTLLIKPLTSYKQLPKHDTIKYVMFFLGLGALFSIIYLSPYAINSLSLSARELRMSLSDSEVLPSSILTTIAVGFPTFYYIYAFLFYISIVQKYEMYFRVLMLFGVLSFIINVFIFAGRDGVLFSGIAMVLGYFYFEQLLSNKTKSILRKIFWVVFGSALLIVIKITTDRFAESETFDMVALKKGFIAYLGMQPYIFCDWLNYYVNFHYGHNNFKLIVDLIGIPQPSKVYVYKDPYVWMFPTFLGSFYSVSGFSSLLLITLGFYISFRISVLGIVKNKYSIIGVLFLLGLFFHFITSGLFYFRLGNSGGNLFMIICFLVFYINKKRKFV